GVNTCDTSPTPLCIDMVCPSATAIPAASCPRCCRAYKPKNVMRATSSFGAKIPITPHSSCGLSSSNIIDLLQLIQFYIQSLDIFFNKRDMPELSFRTCLFIIQVQMRAFDLQDGRRVWDGADQI